MTVSTTITRVAYAGDGSTVAFPVTFPFFDSEDLEVIERVVATGAEATKSLASDYGVTGGNGAPGTVVAATPPAAAVQWIIRRRTPLTQLIDYTSNDSFPAESHEKGLDRGVLRDQEAAEELSRALRLPKTDSITLSTTLPSSVDRANRYLKFDASGNPIVAQDVAIGTLSLPVAIADGGTGATNAAGARAALGLAGLADDNLLTGANRFQGAVMLESGDGSSVEGPVANFDRLSASPAANDAIGVIAFRAKGGGGNTLVYAKLGGQIIDPADASEDGRLLLQTVIAGTLGARAYVGDGVVVGSPVGADKGGGTINALALYQNGAAMQPKISYAKYSFTVGSGTGGGNTVATTWTTLALNTEDNDADGIGALSGNQVTLGAGTYRIRAWCVFQCVSAAHNVKLRLQNITDGTTPIIGGNLAENEGIPNTGNCSLEGEFTLPGSKALALQYWASAANTGGLGPAVGAGVSEVYRVIELWKVA